MATDGDTDYSTWTDAQLEEALANVTPDRFPQNHAALLAEIERRKVARAAADASPSPGAGEEKIHKLEFRGSGGEYFRIWIVNLALTVVTLGIYSAWAKVRRLRYMYGNTTLAGSAFGYHGQPLKILKGRLIAATFAGAYFASARFSPVLTAMLGLVIGLTAPWLIVKSHRFSMRMTSWRGLRFGFAPDYAGAYKTFIGYALAAGVTLGILIPVMIRQRYRFLVGSTGFGGQQFTCEPRVGRFYKTYGIALVMSLLIVFGCMLVVGALIGAFIGGLDPEHQAKWTGMALSLLMYALLFALVGAYVTSRNLNEVFGHTTLAKVSFRSTLSAGKLAGLYLSIGALTVLTLGLYLPFAHVRLLRYRLECLEISTRDDFAGFVGTRDKDESAVGEEMTDFFDLDFGL